MYIKRQEIKYEYILYYCKLENELFKIRNSILLELIYFCILSLYIIEFSSKNQ